MQFRRAKRTVDGVLLLDKSIDMSSNHALMAVRRIYRAAKAGHTGTLDPLATGLLPLCLGEATKFSSYLLNADKTYQAQIRLGVTTTTGDAEGAVLNTTQPNVAPAQIVEVCAQFVGEITQVPPMYSALKHQGRALYEYAREGIEIERAPRRITIHRLQVLQCEQDFLEISVRCSKGTYIRTLAEDIGKALGCGAHLLGLRRTESGGFDLASAHTLQQLEATAAADLDNMLLPIDCLLQAYSLVEIDAESLKRLLCGQTIQLPQAYTDGSLYRIYSDNKFYGVGQVTAHALRPVRLCAGAS